MSQQINLYNPIFLQQRKIFSAMTMLQALALLVLGLGLMWAYAYYQVATLRAELAHSDRRLQAERTRLSQFARQLAPRTPSADLAAQVVDAEAQVAAMQSVLRVVQQGGVGTPQGFSAYFKALARQTVEGVWLTGFAVSGEAMWIHGRTVQPQRVADYLQRLGAEEVMRGRHFAVLDMHRPKPASGAVDAQMPAWLEFSLRSQWKEVQE